MKLSSAFSVCVLAAALPAQPLHAQTRDSLATLKPGTSVRLFGESRRIDGTWSALRDSSVVIQHAGLSRVLALSAIDSITRLSGPAARNSSLAIVVGAGVGAAASLAALVGSCAAEPCSAGWYVAVPVAFTTLGALGGAVIRGMARPNPKRVAQEQWLVVYRRNAAPM